MSTLRTLYSFLSRLLISFNPPPATTNSISINPNSTTATTSSSPPHLISPTQSDRPILSLNAFDLELGNQSPPIPIANHSDGMPEWRRIGKVAQTVGLGGFGASITLIVNTPTSATIHPAICTAYLTVVCLGIITSIGLSIFSAIMKGSPTVGWVQKKLIYFTLCFVSLACLLRLQLALPLVDIGFGAVPVLTGMIVIVLYLLLGSRCQRQTHETGGEI